MKADDIMSALQDVDPALLDAADAARQAPKKRGGIYRLPLAVRITAIAACAALLIVGVFGLYFGLSQQKPPVSGPTYTTATSGSETDPTTSASTATTTTSGTTSQTTATGAPSTDTATPPSGTAVPSASASASGSGSTSVVPSKKTTTTGSSMKKTTVTKGTTQKGGQSVAALASPQYPQRALNPRLKDVTLTAEEKALWYSQKRQALDLAEEYGSALDAYLTTAVPTFLCNEKQENRVVSPLNTYLALSMLTEVTAGNTRDQLLTLLDAPHQDALRERANGLWNAAYQKDGTVTGLLASSLWLRDKFSYKQAPLTQLADTYYASAYSGKMGSAAYDRTLQKWLDDNTGGLLSEYAKQQTLDEDTVIALATTLYFSAKWDEGFREGNTAPRAFYAPDKTVTCDFMNDERKTDYVDGEGFCAVAIALEQSGYMWVFLPDEGISPDTLPAQQAVWDVAQWKTTGDYRTVTLALPKFDVSSELDLCDGLKALGVTDIMNRQKADFSPLFDKSANPLTDAELSKAPHAARVKIDEEGCEAAAFTLTAMTGAAAPLPTEPIPFVADRPFFFVVTGEGDLPLFAGTVYHP